MDSLLVMCLRSIISAWVDSIW